MIKTFQTKNRKELPSSDKGHAQKNPTSNIILTDEI